MTDRPDMRVALQFQRQLPLNCRAELTRITVTVHLITHPISVAGRGFDPRLRGLRLRLQARSMRARNRRRRAADRCFRRRAGAQNAATVLGQQVTVQGVIVVAEESACAAVTALGDVMRKAGDDDTGEVGANYERLQCSRRRG
jgi:hypothetical protein